MELQKQVGIEIVKRRKELGISQDEWLSGQAYAEGMSVTLKTAHVRFP